MTYLADVNVWVALAIVDHIHHDMAFEWLESVRADRVAFCRVTQNGLLRLLTNRRILGDDVLTPPRAWEVYDTLRRNSQIEYAQEPAGIEKAWRESTRQVQTGPNFWTDAYLAGFASAAGYTVVTFDRAFRQFKLAQVTVLPVV